MTSTLDKTNAEKTVVVLQPGYWPWLGFFEQLYLCDVFVLYDDVQFDKHGWRNRNRVKSPQGPAWLSVPVLHKGKFGQPVNEVQIDNSSNWSKKHFGTIQQFYAKAPYFSAYKSDLAKLYSREWTTLLALNNEILDLCCKWLGLSRKIVFSSELGIVGEQSERLLNICRAFEARKYLSGQAAKDYLQVQIFNAAGINVEFQDYQHPTYPQQYADFVPYLSVLDLFFNCGPQSLRVILGDA